MKQEKDYTIHALLFVLLLAILGSMISCSNGTVYDPSTRDNKIRVKVLENGTISYVDLSTDYELEVYKPGDTVWLNLATHQIDDTSTNTMKVVLLAK